MTLETAAPAAPAAAPSTAALPETATTAVPPPETKPEQPPEKTFSQKELDDILEKRLAKERRKREELQRRLSVTEELALRGRPEPKAEPKPAESNEPKRENYQDYEAFIEARAEWRADKRVDERLDKDRKDREQSSKAEVQQKLESSFREHAQKVATEIEDFEEVLSTASETKISRPMADAIMHSGEMGPRILYHLAKNKEEAQRIAALPEPRQAAEIGKIEAKLSVAPEPKKPSKAPEPITPIGGKAPATDDEPDAKDTKAWIDWRNRKLRAAKQRR